MHIETWILTGVFTLGSIVFGYGLFRGQVTALTDKLNTHLTEYKKYKETTEKIMSAQFKRIDELNTINVRLQTEASHHIDMEIAEAKFVSHNELDLRLQTINMELGFLTEKSKEQSGKLDEAINILHKLLKVEKDDV